MKKTLFWQGWGTFPGTTMVSVGWKNYKEIITFLKKKKYADWQEALENKGSEFSSPHFSKWIYKDKTYSLLFLPQWIGSKDNYIVLAHELIHGISFLTPDWFDPLKENEAFAYQHTFLFQEIARKLDREYKVKHFK